MKIIPCGSEATVIASAEYFTGRVLQTPMVKNDEPSRLGALSVHFEPGARTFWHTHPLGQTLIIVSGAGRVQSWGQAARIVRAGDNVSFEPGEKHWHGAGPSTSMTHIAIQEMLDGSIVDWMGEVSAEEYGSQAE